MPPAGGCANILPMPGERKRSNFAAPRHRAARNRGRPCAEDASPCAKTHSRLGTAGGKRPRKLTAPAFGSLALLLLQPIRASPQSGQRFLLICSRFGLAFDCRPNSRRISHTQSWSSLWMPRKSGAKAALKYGPWRLRTRRTGVRTAPILARCWLLRRQSGSRRRKRGG